MLVCAVAVATGELFAAQDEVQFQYGALSGFNEPSPGGQSTFWNEFEAGFGEKANDLYSDRFHPLRLINRDLNSSSSLTGSQRDRNARAACNALTQSLLYGLRGAASTLPNAPSLADQPNLITDFILNSIDNVEEQAVASPETGYRVLERSWWKSLSERGMRWGINPFNTSPYAFTSLRIRSGDSLLLLTHLRYHYRNFADHTLQLTVSVPLTPDLAVDLGTSYQFGLDGRQKSFLLKLFREFKSGAILHASLEIQGGPRLFAGMSIPL